MGGGSLKKRSLEKLVEAAAEKYNVSEDLILKILSMERARIYLFGSKRSTVLKAIREMVQEEIK